MLMFFLFFFFHICSWLLKNLQHYCNNSTFPASGVPLLEAAPVFFYIVFWLLFLLPLIISSPCILLHFVCLAFLQNTLSHNFVRHLYLANSQGKVKPVSLWTDDIWRRENFGLLAWNAAIDPLILKDTSESVNDFFLIFFSGELGFESSMSHFLFFSIFLGLVSLHMLHPHTPSMTSSLCPAPCFPCLPLFSVDWT